MSCFSSDWELDWSYSGSWDDGRKFSNLKSFPPDMYTQPYFLPPGSTAAECCERKHK